MNTANAGGQEKGTISAPGSSEKKGLGDRKEDTIIILILPISLHEMTKSS